MASKTDSQKALLSLPAKDRMAAVVREVVNDSKRGYSQIQSMHQEALMNSLGLSPGESFVTSDAPYGQNPRAVMGGDSSPIGSIVSPFTAEQVNSITTRLCAPLIGQREVLYVEPQGVEDVLKCAVASALFERTIRSAWTSWADLCWRTCRDLSVRSRAYWEVRPQHIVRKRRQYRYEEASEVQELLAAGIDPQELAMLGPIRSSYVAEQTLWNGPVIVPLLYGTVHKDRADTILSDNSLFVVVEREMSWEAFCAEGAAKFPTKAKGGETTVIPFNADRVSEAVQRSVDRTKTDRQTEFDPTGPSPRVYEPVCFQEFQGIDPTGAASDEAIAWVVGGETIAQKGWDGSGDPKSVVEWAWDPINGMATSVGPAMLLRSPQEMLSILLNCATTAAIWDSVLSGGINTDRVMQPNQVRNLKPTQFFNLTGTTADGPPLVPIELGKNAAATMQFIRDQEAGLRLATAGISSVVGEAPKGVNTLGEFAGVTQGALDRIGTQFEINADVALRRTFALQHSIWRDGFATDDDLAAVLGQNEDTLGATLADLDGPMDVIVLASRYHQVRQQTINALSMLYTEAKSNPGLAARLKPTLDDAFANAIAGPGASRYLYATSELAAMGIDLNAIKLQQIALASTPGQPGTPSPPKEQPTTGAGQVEQQGATV